MTILEPGVVRNRNAFGRLFKLMAWVGLIGLPAAALGQTPLGTTFSYQGFVERNGVPLDGTADFRFQLFGQLAGGTPLGFSQVFNVTVSSGAFTVQAVDFGTAQLGLEARWIQVSVRYPAGDPQTFVTLTPRHPLRPAPVSLTTRGIKVDDAGRVGIGTSQPGAQLDVDGSTRLRGSVHIGSNSVCYDEPNDRIGSHNAFRLHAGLDYECYVGATWDAGCAFISAGERGLLLQNMGAGVTPNVIAGSQHNASIDGASGAAIAGGGEGVGFNEVSDNFGAIGGGWANHAGDADGNPLNAHYATVGGGEANSASGAASTVGGGSTNTASANHSTVSGGEANWASRNSSTIGGGGGNFAMGDFSTVGGGLANQASGDYGTVAGGWANRASQGSTVGGGLANSATASHHNTIAGGEGNGAGGPYSTVGGGYQNVAGQEGTVGGGAQNWSAGIASTIGGGRGNMSLAVWSTVAGGLNNNAWFSRSTIGGGEGNIAGGVAGGNWSTIGGGELNTTGGLAGGDWSTIGGGQANVADGDYAFVGGGQQNEAHGWATVGGGFQNVASDTYSTVSGGNGNEASGFASAVPGGDDNLAGGHYSFAAGRRAKVRDPTAVGGGDTDGDEGTFVWADSTFADFTSTGPDQFLIRASGGVGIGVSDPDAMLHVYRETSAPTNPVAIFQKRLPLLNYALEIGGLQIEAVDMDGGPDPSLLLNYYHSGNVIIANGGGDVGVGVSPSEKLDVNGTARLRGIQDGSHLEVHVDSNGVLWRATSSLRYKENVRALPGDPASILKLRPVAFDWRSTGNADVGLIAEEVAEVLPELVVRDNEGRPEGVRYNQVALYLLEVVKEQQARLTTLEASRAEKDAQIADLSGRLDRLEAAMNILKPEKAGAR